jgi:site-specific DNA-methyltransferase (adenine-specific)
MTDIDLRLGDWRDVLADVECDALICDPPYGARTHRGHNAGADMVRAMPIPIMRQSLDYAHLTPGDVRAFVEHWAPRTRGWMCIMTSHDLVMPWLDSMEAAGRYSFAPLPVIQKRPRLGGDGPASWCVWLVVSRPRKRAFSTWGCLPGAYDSQPARYPGITGGKPLALMRAIVGDYTDPGDVVCDPCAGYATTLVAARELGCRAVGAEMDEATHARAMERIAHPWQPYQHPRAGAYEAKRNRRAQTDLFSGRVDP